MGAVSAALLCAGAYVGSKTLSKRKLVEESATVSADDVKEMLPPTVSQPATANDDNYLPWWTGVREISIYLNEENINVLDKRFDSIHPIR